MLIVDSQHLNQIVAEAQNLFPHECCGFLLGRFVEGGRRVDQVLPAVNEAAGRKRSRFFISPAQRLAVEQERRNMDIVGFYHSHPDGGAYFSETDLRHSEEYRYGKPWVPPTFSYLVIGLKAGKRPDYGSFIVRDGVSLREETVILPGVARTTGSKSRRAAGPPQSRDVSPSSAPVPAFVKF